MQPLLRLLAAWFLVVGSVVASTVASASTDATAPGAIGPPPTDRYVDAVHRLFLARPAGDVELDHWRHVVHRDGPAALTTALSTSREWAGARIDELYHRILGRAPDDDGRRHWREQLTGGTTLPEVAATLHGSEEYLARVGGDPGEFVDSLYRLVLRREPDPDGRRHWLDRLEQGVATRTGVARSLLGSVESRRQRVERAYDEVLDRSPDAPGREFWVERLPELGDRALVATLAGSDEFHRRATGVPLPVVSTAPVGPGTRYPLTHSWRSGCPVPPDDLVAVEFDHFTMDGDVARGVLIVHRSVAADAAAVTRAMYGSRFPLTGAQPVDAFGGDDDASMRADNTSAFNCRTVAGTTTWSEHAYGLAIDINPVENPYVHEDGVEPPAGEAYTDRSDVRPGMVVEAGPVVGVFDHLGWGWGGRWSSAQDHQHFSRSGR